MSEQKEILVYFFKESGKWHAVESINWWRIEAHEHVTQSFSRVLAKRFQHNYIGMTAVCIDSPAGFPLMVRHDP